MQTLNLYGKQDIRYEKNTPEPTIINSDDVIIKVKAAGICGSDLSRFAKLGPYVRGMTFGHEFSGEVVDIATGVTQVKVGDRVAGCPTFVCGKCDSCVTGFPARCEKLVVIGAYHPGAYAEYTKLPESHVIKLPENVDYNTAALVEPSAVVAHGFYQTSMQAGSEVAIIGVGSIGLLAIQWAKIFGAKKIYAIDIDQQKLAVAKQLGADVVIHSKGKSVYSQLMDYTNGRGVDLAVEAAGSPITSKQVLALPRKGGEVIFMGIPYADISMERFYFEKIVRGELVVYGSWNAVSSPFPGKEWSTTIHFMSQGQIRSDCMISHVLSLADGPEVFRKTVNNQINGIKILFHPEKVAETGRLAQKN
ncbi:galactitol-1-phosphate 5-dehydrogenase [Virgibacillus dokdonensis]|uniref:Galactitol-1-phosphate 5-dehydrogenase n=1 Tax=Virgibacillus dokdonensis TaxID=302167 RepID=A0A3E0WQV6_9BACI|nr:galactitol-1-phosphate 5-dehydrogenase [Virgibacillus dokdonensis]RFA34789.1 galactitol-1-phosphate 5-dehydrogenase [Virgibacillus dokdonensis]